MNGSFIAATMIRLHGTDEQRRRLLPQTRLGRDPGRVPRCPSRTRDPTSSRSALEPCETATTTSSTGRRCGSRTPGRARADRRASAKTDPSADPPHLGMTGFLVEKEPDGDVQPRPPDSRWPPPPQARLQTASRRPRSSSTASGRRRRRCSAARRAVGQGFKYFMSGIEVGRVNVAARGAGLARAALDDAVRYARRARGRSASRSPSIRRSS